jgi:hypothetical protein
MASERRWPCGASRASSKPIQGLIECPVGERALLHKERADGGLETRREGTMRIDK